MKFHEFQQYYCLNFREKFLFYENHDILSMDELDHDDIQDDNNQHNLPKIILKKNRFLIYCFSLNLFINT